jgi:hypothetical protein
VIRSARRCDQTVANQSVDDHSVPGCTAPRRSTRNKASTHSVGDARGADMHPWREELFRSPALSTLSRMRIRAQSRAFFWRQCHRSSSAAPRGRPIGV